MPVWMAFLELDAARGANGFGPNPLSYTEIDAWARLTGARLSAWEVSLLRDIDRVVIEKTARDAALEQQR